MRGVAILLSAFACMTSGHTAQAAPNAGSAAREVAADNDRAREQFRLGVNAIRAERLDEARQLLTEAWRLRRTYDVAASLAQVESELGHYTRAAELLDFCLNNFAPIESETRLQQLRQAFDDVRRRVMLLDLSAVPPGVEVRVDGVVVGTTPLGTTPYLEPGSHVIGLNRGTTAIARPLQAEAGGQQRVELDARHSPSASPNATARDHAVVWRGRGHTDPAPSARQRPSLPYYLGGALLAVGATTAVVFQVAANNHQRRATTLRSQPGASDCQTKGATFSALCSELAEADTQRIFSRNLAIGGYAIAATALVATAVYWLWPSPKPSSTASANNTSWTLGYVPSGAWLGASRTFP